MAPGELQRLVESTVRGLGLDLAELELSNRNSMLRVFIDRAGLPVPGGGVTLEDCERVTRQLQRVFEVEGVEYGRMEVSSPGLDRKLKSAADFERFAGFEADLRLRETLNGRRRFVGVLSQRQDGKFALDYEGGRLEFTADEGERARLVPKL